MERKETGQKEDDKREGDIIEVERRKEDKKGGKGKYKGGR